MIHEYRTAPHPHFAAGATYLFAATMPHVGYTPHRWIVDCCLEQSDRDRSQWTVSRVFDTEHEADAHGRLWFDVALPLWELSLRTRERVETPADKMAAACRLHVDGLAEIVALRAAAETGDRYSRDDARHRLRKAVAAAEAAFFSAHSWVDFVAQRSVRIHTTPAVAAQMSLF